MSAAGGEKRKPLAKWAFRGACPSSFLTLRFVLELANACRTWDFVVAEAGFYTFDIVPPDAGAAGEVRGGLASGRSTSLSIYASKWYNMRRLRETCNERSYSC